MNVVFTNALMNTQINLLSNQQVEPKELHIFHLSNGVLCGGLDVIDVGNERNILPKVRYSLKVDTDLTVGGATVRVFKIYLVQLFGLK